MLTLPAVLGAAIADSWNPCAIGVLLLLVSLIVMAQHTRRFVLLFGATYVLGVYISYFFIGLGLLQAAHLFGIHNFFGWLAASLLVIFGIAHLKPSLVTWIPGLSWLLTCKVPSHKEVTAKRGALVGGLILGVFVGICEFPCTGAIYLAVVALLASQASYWQGVGYLVLYNLIFVLPLVVVLFAIGRPAVLKQIESWQRANVLLVSQIIGAVMLVSGIAILAWLLAPYLS